MAQTISPADPAFDGILDVLDIDPELVEIEPLGGLESDDEDLAQQRQLGVDPLISRIEIIARWSEEGSQGVIEWFFLPVSAADLPESQLNEHIEFGGALLGFFYEGEEPPLDDLVEPALAALNEQIEWAEFIAEEPDGESND